MNIARVIPLAVVAMSAVFATDQVVDLNPTFSLDLRPTLNSTFSYPVHIGAFAATPKSLHLLVRPVVQSAAQQAVVEIDFTGKVLGVSRLNVDVESRWIQVNAAGETLVWKRAHPFLPGAKETIYKVAKTGIAEAATFGQRIRYPAKLGDTMWGLTPTGCIRYGAPAETRVCGISEVDPNGTGFMYEPLSRSELVAIEPSAPALIRLSPERGQLVTTRIVSPEILYALSVRRSNPASAVIVNDLAVESDQRIWVSVTLQPISQGASLLRLNPAGDVEGRFRCPLKKDVAMSTTENPQGFMLPSQIGFANSTLFVLDGRGLLAACQAPASIANSVVAKGE